MDDDDTDTDTNVVETQVDNPQIDNPQTETAVEQTVTEAGPSERELQLEQTNKDLETRLKKAEGAIAASERAKKQAERDKMTKDEQLNEREKDISEREREINLRDNRSLATNALAGLNIAEGDIEHFVFDDKERTLAACDFFKDFLSKRDASITKAVEDKYVREFGKPPVTGGESTDAAYEEKLSRAIGLPK